MDKQTKKIIGIVVIVVIVIFSLYFIWGFITYKHVESLLGPMERDLEIRFEQDFINKTLTVVYWNESEIWYWEDVVITHGEATLPTGTIDIGDVVTNCEGDSEWFFGLELHKGGKKYGMWFGLFS